MNASFATRAAALAHISANGLTGFHPYGLRANGVDRYEVRQFDLTEVAAPVRNERVLYTASGKRSTSKIACGRAFKKHPNDRAAFINYAVSQGVKRSTANAMFSHYSKGRYAA